MTKRVKICVLAALTALLLLCAGILAFPTWKASADDTWTSDNNFEYVAGASVKYRLFGAGVDPTAEDFELSTAKYDLGFYFRLKNRELLNLSERVSSYAEWWWGTRADNIFIYEFTLYAGNRDGDGAGSGGSARPQSTALILLFPVQNSNTFYAKVAIKDYYGSGVFNDNSYCNFKNNASTDLYDNVFSQNGKTFNVNGTTQKFGGTGYTIIKSGYLTDGESNLLFNSDEQNTIEGLFQIFAFSVNSPFSSYYVKTRYCFQTTDFVGFFGTSYKCAYGEIVSSSRSVAQILINMQNNGANMAAFGDNETYVNDIIRTNATERVRVKYLTEIPGTPYATHNFAYVDVPVLQDTIYVSDVEKALGISLNKCLDSNAYYFTLESDDSGDYYQLNYLRNVWLRAMTEDSNYLDYFLDINKSFKEMYYPFVQSGILSDGAFEWIYSTQFLNKFPALQDYRFNEVYGYFGLIVIPESYTLNTALKEMFDVKTSKIGVISSFSYAGTLSYEAYEQLLDEYHYSWLNKVWAHYVNFVGSTSTTNATYYVVYSEPGTENALIGEGGQTDAEDGSLIGGAISDYTGIFVDVWGTFFNSAVGLLKGAGNHLPEILIIAAIIAGVILLFKFGIIGGNKRRRK